MTNKKICFFFLLPVLLNLLLHLHVFNLDIGGFHSWRQAQTQTVIYNFSFVDHSILHPQRFDLHNGNALVLYEFPLYQWIIAQINNILEYSVANTRALTFVFFIFLLIGFYKLLRNFVSVEIALLSNVLVCFSPILYYYEVTPLPDTLALCFANWGLYFFFTHLKNNKVSSLLFFSFFIMLAALVKLPYILFAGVFCWYAYKRLLSKDKSVLLKSICLFLFLMPVAAWYSYAIPTWEHNPITKGILNNDKSLLHLLDCFQFNILSTVPETITNYAACIFLVTGMYRFFKQKNSMSDTQQYFVVLFVLFTAYFLFELNAIEKVHDYYLMPFIPLIFMVVTYGMIFFYDRNNKRLILFFVCMTPLIAWLRMHHRWSGEPNAIEKDFLTEQVAITSVMPADALCIVDHDDSRYEYLYFLKRFGYSLSKNEIDTEKLKLFFSKGANYLVTDNEKFDPANYPGFFFTKVFDKHIKIYKLSLN